MAPPDPAQGGKTAREGVTVRRTLWVLVLSLLVALLGLTFSLLVGDTAIDYGELLRLDPETSDYQKVFRHRLPRALAAMIVGGALALSGVVFQALIRNPLASPYILGVSAGGSLGAVVALAAGLTMTTPAAFVGACVAIALVYTVARTGGRVPSTTLLLAGVIVNAFFAAAIMLVNLMASPDNQARILRWLVGGMKDDYTAVGLIGGAIPVAAVAIVVFMLSRQLNLVSLGDLDAERAGVAVGRTRTLLFLLASLATAVAVSIAGPIGFVGLIVPHLLRLIVGPDHRVLLPAALLVGGCFLTIVDTIGQSVWTTPLPAGVVTAFIGGPLFLALLWRRDRARAGLDG